MASRWYDERRREGYYKQAKREGYRARSAYKLLQIQERFSVVRASAAVADLGAAPGGWSQVLIELAGERGLVVGVDLQRIRPIPGARFLQGDFTRPETQTRLQALLAGLGREKLDCVVSDMSPDMSGSYELDQVRSVYLAQLALAFAERNLQTGGNFVCKLFEGRDFQEFRGEVRERFHNVYQFHPAASRKSSSEIYLVAKGYKGAGVGAADKEKQGTAAETEDAGEEE